MRTILLGIFLLFVGFVGSLFIKSGAWKEVTITEVDLGPFVMIYKDFMGPYHKIVPVIQEVEAWAKSQNIDCSQSFGEYIDDPGVVEHERLKSRGGCIVKEIPQNLPPGFLSQTIPPRHYVMGEFSGSPALGPMKVYGKITDKIASNRWKVIAPVIEIYRVTNKTDVTTQYLFAIEKWAEK